MKKLTKPRHSEIQAPKSQLSQEKNNAYCLITGGASGIGFEFAKLFLRENYNIILVDISGEKLEKAKLRLKKDCAGEVLTIKYNLCKRGVAWEIYKKLNEENIRVDVLINNAGFGVFGEFHQTDLGKQSDLIELSISTNTQLTHLFLKDMVERNHGRILNIASIAAFQPGPLMAVYYATKAYLLSFSRAIANELKNTNVTVTVLCPGMTRTGFQSANGNPNPKYGILSTTAQKVANYGFQALMKGKSVAIPRFYNRIISNIHRFLPLETATRLSRFLQEKNRVKIIEAGIIDNPSENQTLTVQMD